MKKSAKFLSLTLCFCFLLFQNKTYAQKEPFKFGKPSQAELEMKVCPFDTAAAAMFLYDYGYFNAENFFFERLIRLKIFKKEGYEWANWEMTLPETPVVNGISFNLENGQVAEQKLRAASVYTKINHKRSYTTSFALPGVKEGTVLDIKVTYSGVPYEWYFQNEIPTGRSELEVFNSSRVQYRQIFFGFEPLAVVEPNHWVSKNVPAFVPERYINCRENYISKCEFELYQVEFKDYKAYLDSWSQVNNYLLRDEELGQAMGYGLFLIPTAQKIEKSAPTELEKIKKAFEFVKASVKWNGEESAEPSQSDIGEVFLKKTGNSTDINLILVLLLKKLKFNVNPLLMSTVNNGVLSKTYPSLGRINYIIASVKLSDGSVLNLDATESYIPYYLLPARCHNGFGELLEYGKTEFVPLEQTKSDQRNISYNLELKEDLTFEGKLTYSRSDYAAFYFRKKYFSFNSETEFISDFKKENQGLEITKYKLDNLDSIYKPVKEEYEIQLSGRCDDVNGELYFNPFFLDAFEENPFKPEHRKYPVHYFTTDKFSYTVIIKLPEQYTLAAKPDDIIVKTPDNSASFQLKIIQNGNTLVLSSKFTVNKTDFLISEYPHLREFFERVVKKTNEQVILKKI